MSATPAPPSWPAWTARRRGEIINVGSGHGMTLDALLALLSRLSGRTPRIRRRAAPAGDTRLLLADIAKAGAPARLAPPDRHGKRVARIHRLVPNARKFTHKRRCPQMKAKSRQPVPEEMQVASGYKIAAHRERVLSYLRGEAIFPVCLEFDLTSRCSRACRDCPSTRASEHWEVTENSSSACSPPWAGMSPACC